MWGLIGLGFLLLLAMIYHARRVERLEQMVQGWAADLEWVKAFRGDGRPYIIRVKNGKTYDVHRVIATSEADALRQVLALKVNPRDIMEVVQYGT